MNRFRTNKTTEQSIPTSTLPDIIFILLFFFMVATVVRPELLLDRELPHAQQLLKLQKDLKKIHFYVGTTIEGDLPIIQMNGSLMNVQDLEQTLVSILPEKFDQNGMVVMEIDHKTSMGMVIEIQEVLRRKGFRKVMYYSQPFTESQ